MTRTRRNCPRAPQRELKMPYVAVHLREDVHARRDGGFTKDVAEARVFETAFDASSFIAVVDPTLVMVRVTKTPR